MHNEKAKARWSILRNALLQRSQVEASKHSIHSFPGYQLLRPSANPDIKAHGLELLLKVYHWRKDANFNNNIDALRLTCLALAAVAPKGRCLEVSGHNDNERSWVATLREVCKPSLNILTVDSDNTTCTVLLIQEASSSTKFKACQYLLDKNTSLWTREPRETRLSLSDLVSHRTTGVDNTGNVCVWDSELTLSYMLYNYKDDFPFTQQEASNFAVLELGTGMAGLAAVSIALRLSQGSKGNTLIQVTLTDGHPDGVLNNRVNQFLTKLALSATPDHPYHCLDISTQVLLWTHDLEGAFANSQDLVLVSDCTHFQNFHSALAITLLRCLKVGGFGIFCQPTRGDSLGNFHKLLATATTFEEDLFSIESWTHPFLSKQHETAARDHSQHYDPNLHCPKIFIIKKLRELTQRDCDVFVNHQKTRSTPASKD